MKEWGKYFSQKEKNIGQYNWKMVIIKKYKIVEVVKSIPGDYDMLIDKGIHETKKEAKTELKKLMKYCNKQFEDYYIEEID